MQLVFYVSLKALLLRPPPRLLPFLLALIAFKIYLSNRRLAQLQTERIGFNVCIIQL